MKEALFLFVALITVGSALYVAFSKNIVYSAFSLLLTLAGTAALYLILSADFVAMVQLMVYVGGILVLILFAVMITRGIEQSNSNPSRFIAVAPILAFLLFALFANALWNVSWEDQTPGAAGITKDLGFLLITDYLLPFEVISILLLVGLLGSIAIVRLTQKSIEKEIKEKVEHS
jgi:NADH-quinone oxidoreductase subunit J